VSETTMSAQTFSQKIIARGVELDLKTRLLFIDILFFINGEDLAVPSKDRPIWRTLANTRILPADEVKQLSENSFSLLQNLVNSGYLHIR
jgi:50S ribosomal protein L16 3-hydroxylase